MSSLAALLLRNSNYRYTWMGQVVSEIVDYFNNAPVLAPIMHQSGSGLLVSGFWPARAIPAVLAGPVAGVLLDRLDRRRIMISSDVVRAAVALAFVAATPEALKPSAAPPPTPSSQKPKPEIGFVPE